jgi:hypothetical protein
MKSYQIKKKMVDQHGKVVYLLLTDGHSEVLEYRDKEKAEAFVKIMNENSDSGWEYTVVPVG